MKVIVFGGTHGNETNGIWLAESIQEHPHLFARSNLEIQSYLANPRACERRQRYCDYDLNRCFNSPELQSEYYEVAQAQTIHALMNSDKSFVIDLHTSTAHMGITFIIAHSDPFIAKVAFLAQKRILGLNVLINDKLDSEAPLLIAAASQGIIVEIGPVAQGILDFNIIKKMEFAVNTLLDILDELQTSSLIPSHFSLSVYQEIKPIAFPKNKAGKISGIIHPRLFGKDFHELPVDQPLFMDAQNQKIHVDRDQIYYPIFINEAAYYEKDIAMILTQRKEITFDT